MGSLAIMIMTVAGAVCSTLSMLLVDPKNTGTLDAGLYGFNGFLVGEAIGNFVSTGESFGGSVGTSDFISMPQFLQLHA